MKTERERERERENVRLWECGWGKAEAEGKSPGCEGWWSEEEKEKQETSGSDFRGYRKWASTRLVFSVHLQLHVPIVIVIKIIVFFFFFSN